MTVLYIYAEMLQREGNKGDAYPYSILLPVPGMHRMITTEGVTVVRLK